MEKLYTHSGACTCFWLDTHPLPFHCSLHTPLKHNQLQGFLQQCARSLILHHSPYYSASFHLHPHLLSPLSWSDFSCPHKSMCWSLVPHSDDLRRGLGEWWCHRMDVLNGNSALIKKLDIVVLTCDLSFFGDWGCRIANWRSTKAT